MVQHWAYTPGPNCGLACTSNLPAQIPLLCDGVALLPGRLQHQDKTAPGAVRLLKGLPSAGSHRPSEPAPVQAVKAASFQSLVEAAERDDPLNQGWRILPDEGTHSGLSTAQVAEKRGQELIKRMYARLGLASTQSTAVSAAARAAVPRVAQQHGVPPVKVPHSLLEDVAVVSQLRRVRPYVPVYKPTAVVLGVQDRAAARQPPRAGAMASHARIQRQAARTEQPATLRSQGKGGQKKHAKPRRKSKAAAKAPHAADQPFGINALPELPTEAVMRRFQIAPRPQLDAAWAAIAQPQPQPSCSPAASQMQTSEHAVSDGASNPSPHDMPVDITLSPRAFAAATVQEASSAAQLAAHSPTSPASPAQQHPQQPQPTPQLPASPPAAAPAVQPSPAAAGQMPAVEISAAQVHVVPTRPSAAEQPVSPGLQLHDLDLSHGEVQDDGAEDSETYDLGELQRLLDEQQRQLESVGALGTTLNTLLAPTKPETHKAPQATAAAKSVTPVKEVKSGSRLVAELRELGVPLDGLLAELLSASPASDSPVTSTHSLSTEWSWEAELKKLGIN